MALFASRPEEPSEWAGIPSEPREAGSPSEHLDVAAAARIDGLIAADAVQSIVIPIALPAEPAPVMPTEESATD